MHLRIDRRGGNIQLANVFQRPRAFLGLADHHAVGYGVHIDHANVAAHAQKLHQALVFAILRHQGKALANGLAERRDGHLLPAQENFATVNFVDAQDGARKFRTSRADQARYTQHLAAAQIEGNAVEHAFAGDVLDLQHRFAQGDGLLGVFVDHLAADHHRYQIVAGNVFHRHGAHMATIAQHGYVVGQVEDFVQAVGDVNNGHSLLAQALDRLEHDLLFLLGQRGRRLVHNQQAAVAVDGLADFHHLFLRHRQVADHGVDVQRQAQLAEHFGSALAHGLPVHADALVNQVAQEHVFRHREGLGKFNLLVHHAHARGLRFARRLEVLGRALKEHFAAFGLVNASQHLDQRRFARAVLAHQRMHRAALNGERNIVQRLDARETLADVAKFKDNVAQTQRLLTCGGCAARPAPPRRP